MQGCQDVASATTPASDAGRSQASVAAPAAEFSSSEALRDRMQLLPSGTASQDVVSVAASLLEAGKSQESMAAPAAKCSSSEVPRDPAHQLSSERAAQERASASTHSATESGLQIHSAEPAAPQAAEGLEAVELGAVEGKGTSRSAADQAAGASSVQQSKSAGTAAASDSMPSGQSGLRGHRQDASATSRRLTAEQQGVVAALLVVLKRAAKQGSGALATARKHLTSNNSLTRALIDLLPEDGALPSLRSVERAASHTLNMKLGQLAAQCQSAKCTSLEVSSRSVQCFMHGATLESFLAGGSGPERRQKVRDLHASIARAGGIFTESRSVGKAIKVFGILGVPEPLARLMISYIKVLGMLQATQQISQVHEAELLLACVRSDLDHVLPGAPP